MLKRESAAAIRWQRSRDALGLARPYLVDDGRQRPPRCLDIIEEAPLICNHTQFSELPWVFKAEVGRMVDHGAFATALDSVLEKLPDDGVGLVHVWDVKAAASVHLHPNNQ